MTRSRRQISHHVTVRPVSSIPRNFLALLLIGGAVSSLVLNFHPKPAGAEFGGRSPAFPMVSSAKPGSNNAADSTETENSTTSGSTELEGRLAMALNIAILEDGRTRLKKFPDYSASFYKQEMVDGELQDGQTMLMKCRHEPFSVYMKWVEGPVGQEVLYVEGEHEGRMLVKKGGRVGRLLPALRLDPHGSLAMGESRHPITEAGLMHLAETLIKYRKRDMALEDGVKCRFISEKLGDRDCYRFDLTYSSKEIEPVYHRSITYIDKELSLPLCVKNYGWNDKADGSEVTEQDLIEMYSFSDITFQTRLADNAFDHQNREYTFKR